MSELNAYVAAWQDTVDRLLDLVEDLPAEDMTRLTDCPGWTVRDVLAHVAAIESDLAEAPPATGGSTGEMVAALTQPGVAERADRSVAELSEELRTAAAARAEQLRDLPTDPQTRAGTGSTGLEWSWDRLLRNRVVDLWVHEQDIRRAVGRPGAMGALGAHITTHTFAAALPNVLGKKVGAVPGVTVRVDVTGPVAMTVCVRVDDSGRAHRVEAGDADVRLVMDTEAFTVLAAGRRPVESVAVQVEGDQKLGRRVLEQLAVTP